jgi:protein tyrosine kinase modulator
MTTHESLPEESARGAGLAGLVQVARRRRRLALVPFVLVLVAAASLAMFLPSLWTARAKMLANQQQVPETIVKPTAETDVEARLLTLTQDILDTERLSKVIIDNDLYPTMRHSRPMADVVQRMRKDIAIEPQEDRRDRREPRWLVFSVAYTASDPAVSARVANTLAGLFTEENRRQRERQAVGTSEFLETQLAELRGRLSAQEQRITAYKEQHLGELPEQRDVNVRTLERLEAQLQMAHENNRRAVERRQLINQTLNEMDMASAVSAGGTLVGAPSVAPADTAAARISILRQELAQLRTQYSDKYPDVIQMKEQIRVLEQRIADEQKKKAAAAAAPAKAAPTAPVRPTRDMALAVQNPYVLNLLQQLDQANVDVKASGDEIAGLGRQIAVYQKRLDNTPKRESELAQITRDYESTRETFRSVLGKRADADIAADLEQRKNGDTFRVIEAARVPEQPAGPHRMRLLMVGLAVALVAAGAVVALAEQMDTSYRRAEEVRAAAGVPVLTTIPRIVTESDRRQALRARRLTLAAMAVGLMLVIGTSFVVAHNNQSLVMLLTPEAASTAKR